MKVINLNFRAKIVVNSRYNLNNFWWSEIHLNQVSKGYPTKVFKVKEFLIQLKFFRNRIWYSVCLLWLLKVGGKGSTCFRCNFDSTEVVALPKLFPSFDDYCRAARGILLLLPNYREFRKQLCYFDGRRAEPLLWISHFNGFFTTGWPSKFSIKGTELKKVTSWLLNLTSHNKSPNSILVF